jgi:hypothetical protein
MGRQNTPALAKPSDRVRDMFERIGVDDEVERFVIELQSSHVRRRVFDEPVAGQVSKHAIERTSRVYF